MLAFSFSGHYLKSTDLCIISPVKEETTQLLEGNATICSSNDPILPVYSWPYTLTGLKQEWNGAPTREDGNKAWNNQQIVYQMVVDWKARL